MPRNQSEREVIQRLKELISQVPLMSEKELVELQRGVTNKVLLPDTMRTQHCRNGDECKRIDCRFSHPADRKKAALENAVEELKRPLPGILTRFNEVTRRSAVAAATDSGRHHREHKKNAVEKWSQDIAKEKNTIRDKLTIGICASLNKVTWKNYNVVMSTMGGQLSTLSEHSVLDEAQADKILAMMTRHTAYMECYGQMWSELADAFPSLLQAEKKLLDMYMQYNCHEFDLESRGGGGVALLMAIKHRAALTSFLMHAMKHSTSSHLREGLSEVMSIMVHRMKFLRQGGHCNCREFKSIMSDFLIFVREGWEVLCREEVWPLAMLEAEEIIGQLRKDRGAGRQVELRILFQLQDVLRDVTEQGGYHTC